MSQPISRRRFSALSLGSAAAALAARPLSAAPLSRKWTVFVVQNSHIDIGYTERQEVIADFHYQFVRQAVECALAPAQKDRAPESRFKFTCEGFWQVEQYLNRATPQERDRLLRAMHDGLIELTAGYFHMTELPDQELLERSVSFAADFARKEGVPLNAGMSCDVNGFSWGFADALAGVGVRYFSTNINHHHGGYPFGHPLVPFYWQGPSGKRVLTWSGLAYHRANVLGLMGGLTPDGDPAVPGLDLPGSGDYIDNKDTSLAERKLIPVLAYLESSGYPYDFLPVMGSGTYTDNSPVADFHCDIIAQWNRKHGADVQVRTATLAEFFAHLEKNAPSIPTHRGEWTDWWSDGVASTPRDTILFRNALRTRRTIRMLDPQGLLCPEERLVEVDKKLLLYAEHTFGYSRTSEASVLSEQLFTRKSKHAIDADELAGDAMWRLLRKRGEGSFAARRPFEYAAVNPLDAPARGLLRLPTDFWERSLLDAGLRVVDAAGRVYPHQVEQAPRGLSIAIVAELSGREERKYKIEPLRAEPAKEPPAGTSFTNAHYTARWEEGRGVISLSEANGGTEWLAGPHALGAPIYQVFPKGERWQIGRTTGKRIRPAEQTTPGRCTAMRRLVTGPLFERWEFAYDVPGATAYSVETTFYRDLAVIDVVVKLVKTDVYDPEGMYAAFPFPPALGTWYFDKPGAPMRPGKDQLPGACCDYYCLQDGAALVAGKSGLVFATPDAPLVHVGKLRLWEYNTTIDARGPLFSWLTNNKWETNFRILTGGAYEFRYRIEAAPEYRDPAHAIARCHELSYAPIVLRA